MTSPYLCSARPRIEAIGAVDEGNSQIGLLLTKELPLAVRDCLVAILHD